MGHVLCLRDYKRYALADKPDAIDGDDGAMRNLRPRYDPVRNDRSEFPGKVSPGQRKTNAGCPRSLRHIDMRNDRMGVRRSQDRHMQHARQLQIVDVAALAADEPEILPASQRLTDIRGRTLLIHDVLLRVRPMFIHEKRMSAISIATITGSGIDVPSGFLRSARRFVATLIPEKSLWSWR